jgi:hypothetical protein
VYITTAKRREVEDDGIVVEFLFLLPYSCFRESTPCWAWYLRQTCSGGRRSSEAVGAVVIVAFVLVSEASVIVLDDS